MLHDQELGYEFWGEAVATAVYLKNRSPTSALQGITPEEAKLEPKAIECIFVGYDGNSKAYRGNEGELTIDTDTSHNDEEIPSVQGDIQEQAQADDMVAQTDGDTIVVEIDHPRRSSRETRQPERYNADFADGKQWEKAAQTEFDSIIENKTWEIVDKFKELTTMKHSRRSRSSRRFASCSLSPPSMTEGFIQGSVDKVCKLRRSIYGLKQAGRTWYQKLDACFNEINLTRTNADNCVYQRFDKGKVLLIAVYVDDLIILSNDAETMIELKEKPIQVYRRNPQAIRHVRLQARHDTQSAVGSLMYAMLGTRPDIS